MSFQVHPSRVLFYLSWQLPCNSKDVTPDIICSVAFYWNRQSPFDSDNENIDRNIFFLVKEERRTRGHGVTLAKKQCRLDIIKYKFSQRTVNEWNRLSANWEGAISVNIF